MKISIFDNYLEEQLQDPAFATCFTSGREFFQVIKDQGLELIIESHLQRAVPPGFKFVI